MKPIDSISADVVDCAIRIHRELRLLKQPVGLLLNFSGETMKEGIRRLVNNHQPNA